MASGAALHLRPHPQQERGCALRIEVPQQRRLAVASREVRQVHRRGRLPHAALDAVGGDDLHRAGELSQRLDQVAARLLLAGDEVFHHQLARRDRVARRLTERRVFEQVTDEMELHLGVLELTEIVLQPLHVRDDRLDVLGRQRAAEHLRRVPQPLRPLARRVDVFRGRVVVDLLRRLHQMLGRRVDRLAGKLLRGQTVNSVAVRIVHRGEVVDARAPSALQRRVAIAVERVDAASLAPSPVGPAPAPRARACRRPRPR